MNLFLTTPLVEQSIRYPNAGLAYLASYVRPLAESIRIFIPERDKTDTAFLHDELSRFQPDLVGISVFSLTYAGVSATIKTVKSFKPDLPVILGGPHPSGDPAATMNGQPEADFCMVGEGEIGFRKLTELMTRGNDLTNISVLEGVPGLCYRTDEGLRMNPPEFVQDLDSLPFPAYDLMPPDDFIGASGSGYQKSGRIGYVASSRSCIRRCAFCSGHTVSGRVVRMRSAANICDEIELLTNRFGVREIQFTDSDIAYDTRHVARLCRLILQRKLSFHWSCAACSDSIDPEVIGLMKRSGCYMIRVGIETASARTAKQIHKVVNLRKLEDNIRAMRRCGIRAHGFFMIGFPGERIADIRTTVKFARQSPLDSASFSIFQPLPGSELYTKYVSEEKRKQLKWENFNFYGNTFFDAGVPFRTLKSIQRQAYLLFYLHPRRLFLLLKTVGNPSRWKTFLRMVHRNLSKGR